MDKLISCTLKKYQKEKPNVLLLTVSANRDRICWKDEVLSACFIIKASVAWIQCKLPKKKVTTTIWWNWKTWTMTKGEKKSKRWKRSAEHSRLSTSYYLFLKNVFVCDVTEDFPTAQLCCILKFYRLNWKVILNQS